MNYFKYFLEWLKLTRFEHALLSSLGVLIGLFLASKSVELELFLLSLLVPLFINMGAFVLNDYYDIETDILNKRFDRPLVKKSISPQHAFRAGLFFLFLGVFFSFFINFYAFLIAIFFAILSFLYNSKLKDLVLVGNLSIAFSMAIAFPFGYIARTNSLNFPQLIVFLFFGAFFVGLAREIIKSVQDMEGDKKARNSKTLPILIGPKKAAFYASLLFLIFCFYLFLLLFSEENYIRWNYFLVSIILICIMLFFVISLKVLKLEDLEEIRKTSLIALFIVTFIIFLAILF
ncbi:MAG: UbiA family prenyltransferase [Candidatus Anstonellaceae archaeon]